MRERKERRTGGKGKVGRESKEREGGKGSTSLIALFLFGAYLILPVKDE